MYRVADAHCDYLDKVIRFGYDLDHPQPNQSIILNDMRAGGVRLQFFAAWLDTQMEIPPLNQCLMMHYEFERMLRTHPDAMKRLRADDPGDDGRIAAVFTIEDLGAIPQCLDLIPALRNLGVRAASLTWNFNNPVCGSSMDAGNLGLSEYGRSVVEMLETHRIAIDVSHLSDCGIDDLLACTDRPIFASHSNARAQMDMPRTLTDAHIRAIAEQGGVIGVNFCDEHLTAQRPATIDDVARHIDHVCRVGGVDACAIGTDFDGIDVCPVGLETDASMPALADALAARGYKEDEIRKILYENLHRYILQFL